MKNIEEKLSPQCSDYNMCYSKEIFFMQHPSGDLCLSCELCLVTVSYELCLAICELIDLVLC